MVQMRDRLKKMGLKLCGSMLLYIPRDKPDNPELVVVRNNPDDEWYEATKRKLDRVATGYQLVTPLIKSKSTLKKVTVEQLEQISEYKLCNSKKDYLNNYDPRSAYKGNQPCPLLEVCFKQGSLRRSLSEVVNEQKRKQKSNDR
jgi:hypothetical protein